MTYGWALLIIGLVTAAIFALGIFDVGSFIGSRAVGFSQITPVGWQMGSNGGLDVKFKNDAGDDINITSINATYGAESIHYSTVENVPAGKETGQLHIGTFSNVKPGTSYSIRISIAYNDTEFFEYVDSGMLNGKVV